MEHLLNLQDQYKFPMGQLIYEQAPDAAVTFRMTNRNARRGTRIADHLPREELQEQYDALRRLAFQPHELEILAQQTDKRYSQQFLGYLASFRLPTIEVSYDAQLGDLTAETTAPWNASSLWEIPMLSLIPELYYPRYIEAQGGTLAQVWNEGDRRLSDMISLLRTHPEVKFAEFGTRRRFSAAWQDHALERFVSECPDNLTGTSNPSLAARYGIAAVGTNAHELPMTYAALAETRGDSPLDGQRRVISDWLARFPSMPVALIDTFTSDSLLHDLTDEQIDMIKSYRIDSGDEYRIGHKVISWLESHGHDPQSKTLFFSNSLTAQKAVELADHFTDTIGVSFGIGGHAVNDMGFDDAHDLPSMNIVSKATRVNGIGTVKLSDDAGKHMGTDLDVQRYQRAVHERLQTPSVSAA